MAIRDDGHLDQVMQPSINKVMDMQLYCYLPSSAVLQKICMLDFPRPARVYAATLML